MMKRIAKLLLVIIPVLALAWFGLRAYLSSKNVTMQVASRLNEVYGGPLEVKNVDIGFTGTTLSGLRFFEAGHDATTAKPWLTVQSLHTDLTLTDLIRGDNSPSKVEIQGAHVTLRFDEAGNL